MDRTSTGIRCERCNIGFSLPRYYRAHVGYSINHNICRLCGDHKDFETFTSLQQHLEESHFYCEPCNWFAPSAIGLRQHNTCKHYLCVACGDYFPNAHELNGHAFRHRPRGVSCYCCPQDFSTLSAMFNHLESGNCPSGIEHDDILELAANFVRSYKPERDYIFFCYGCQKPFRRMCDLLQHSETSSCNEGYWRGSGYLGSMVTYIATCIPDYIPDPDDNDDDNNEGAQEGNGNNTTPYPNISIPKIVITGPT
ncbi:hypothetical protein TMEN_4714 [Trichophyton mentagrophytes]|uniref:C2H2-type domain-containing protein n=1 Tax=Trichophyton interdigitale (strain MR816) TaxID=1215338 RepID=A0A059J322_TRIIM|nr:hypothetical protein H101_00113 [Trichophyton interdigitale H6]KDB21892.1 hypothetical protein H109_06157 [Trichophyton interdigitale MR816]GBF62179.1 hypothetical protein TMEN_4714 [Trichophyton mentagrophytes]